MIDPVLSYSTFLGGSNFDEAFDIAVDGAGNAYVTGITSPVNFPTERPLQPGNGSTFRGIADAIVAKIADPIRTDKDR